MNNMMNVEEIANKIAIESSGMFKNIANLMLSQQEINRTPLFALFKSSGFEQIVDKNDMLQKDMKFSNTTDALIVKNDNIIPSAQQILNGVYELLNKIPRDICYRMYVVLTNITQVLIKVENEYKINLSKYKPTVNDWHKIPQLFHVNNFKISKRKSGNIFLYTIYLDYKGLRFKILSIYETYQDRRKIFIDSVIPVINYKCQLEYIMLLLRDNTLSLEMKQNIEKAAEILNMPKYANLDNPVFILQNHFDIDYQDRYLIFNNLGNNDQRVMTSIVNHYEHSIARSRSGTNLPTPKEDAVICYTHQGDRYINSYLLYNLLFNVQLQNNNDFRNSITDECKRFNNSSQFANNLRSAMTGHNYGYLAGLRDDYVIRLYRFTRPSAYGHKSIESFNKNDDIVIPTFVSTSRSITNGITKFTDIYDPLVIFTFYISASYMKQDGNLVFVEKYSYWTHEHEVILCNNKTYKIIDKKYITIKIGDCVVQKLLYVLTFKEDITAEMHYNTRKNSNETKTGGKIIENNTQPNLIEHITTVKNKEFNLYDELDVRGLYNESDAYSLISIEKNTEKNAIVLLQDNADNKKIKNIVIQDTIIETDNPDKYINDNFITSDPYINVRYSLIPVENDYENMIKQSYLYNNQKEVKYESDSTYNILGNILFSKNISQYVGNLNKYKLVTYYYETDLECMLCNHITDYLTNGEPTKNKIKLKNKINGCEYLDKNIFKIVDDEVYSFLKDKEEYGYLFDIDENSDFKTILDASIKNDIIKGVIDIKNKYYFVDENYIDSLDDRGILSKIGTFISDLFVGNETSEDKKYDSVIKNDYETNNKIVTYGGNQNKRYSIICIFIAIIIFLLVIVMFIYFTKCNHLYCASL